MARDDMRVIAYKILRYLYACNKQGARPCFEDMCCNCKLFKIPQDYWRQIILELMELGYIKGFVKLATKDGVTVQMMDGARIAFSGVDYLEDNSSMKRVREQLGGAFEILISSIVSTLL